MKRQATGSEKLFVTHKINAVLVSRICKELIKDNLIEKWTKDMNIIDEEINTVNNI